MADDLEGGGNAAALLSARNLSASLTVRDLDKSLSWYRDILGFAIDRKHDRSGKVFAVSLKAGDVRILIAQDEGSRGVDRTRGEGFSMMITTDQNVDDIARRIKAAGGALDSEPSDTPWGSRMFRLRDPDDFKFTITSEAGSYSHRRTTDASR